MFRNGLLEGEICLFTVLTCLLEYVGDYMYKHNVQEWFIGWGNLAFYSPNVCFTNGFPSFTIFSWLTHNLPFTCKLSSLHFC